MSLRSLVPPVLIVIASALGAAGCTSASSPAPVQVTGTRLESALLPATDFGQYALAGKMVSSGSRLTDRPAVDRIATMSCQDLLASSASEPAFGQTAYARDTVAVISGPAGEATYAQDVLQFARPSAATAYYTQLAAGYARCVSVTVRSTVQHTSVSATVHSVSNVLAGGHQAVAIITSLTAYNPLGMHGSVTNTSDLIVAADGVDVLSVASGHLGSLRLAPTALIVKLIARVQALD